MGFNRTFHIEPAIGPEIKRFILVAVPAEYVPHTLARLELFKNRSQWVSEDDFSRGLQGVNQMQWGLLMDIGTQLILEIRALRGIDELDPNYKDPEADPFTLRMGHIEKVAVELEGVNAKLEAIRLLVEGIQSAETLEDIKQSAAQIALLLA